MCPYLLDHNNRTIDKFDDSPTKSANLVDKLNGDMAELEQIITHMVKTMKNEKEDGDNGIWMNEEDHSASNPLVDNNCFHVDVQE
jgi:hypothetical protein